MVNAANWAVDNLAKSPVSRPLTCALLSTDNWSVVSSLICAVVNAVTWADVKALTCAVVNAPTWAVLKPLRLAIWLVVIAATPAVLSA